MLRQPNLLDCQDLFSIRSDPTVNKYLQRTPPKTIAEISTFLEDISNGIKKGKHLYWCITRFDLPGVIGTICLWNFSQDHKVAEIGYELHPRYQGNGYMSEALQAVVKYSFNHLPLITVLAHTNPKNNSSVRLLTNNHFTRDNDPTNLQDESKMTFSLKKELK